METTITLIDLLAIPVVATGMSLIINTLKDAVPDVSARFITVLMSLVFGGLYYFLVGTPFFAAFVGILMSASTVYGFVLKDKSPDAV